MNFAALQSLSTALRAGPSLAKLGLSSNKYGDVFTLTNKGIMFVNMRRKSSDPNNATTYSTLAITAEKGAPNFSGFEHLVANEDGSSLLLYSNSRLAVIEIPGDNYADGFLSPNATKVTMREILGESDCTAEMKICKAMFHPLNGLSVLVLQGSKTLSVFDLRTKDCQSILLQLPRGVTLTSFTCGPDVEWLRFTVFFAADDGGLYTVCPVIPLGTILTLSVLEELWCWIDDQRALRSGSLNQEEKLRLNYIELLEAYLEDLFGDVQGLLDQFSGQRLEDIIVIAGQGRSQLLDSGSRLREHDLCLRNFHVVMQGPLSVATPITNPSAREKIVDLCVTRGALCGDAAPVVATISTSGRTEILLVELADEHAGYVSPAFRSIHPNDSTFIPARPTLLLADSFKPVADHVSEQWRLTADPVHGHYFYAMNSGSGHCFLLSSSWLRNVLTRTRAGHDDDIIAASDESKSMKIEDVHGEELSQSIPLYEQSETELIRDMSVFFDVMTGHVALLMMSTGDLLAVNVSVHTKLCELYSLDSTTAAAAAASSAEAKRLHSMTEDSQMRFKVAQKLIQSVAKGLTTFPKLEVVVETEGEAKTAQRHPGQDEGRKQLIAVAHQLETSVLQPLEELHQHTLFHAQLVRQLYDIQHVFLHGRGTTSSSASSSSSSSAAASSSATLEERGVLGLIDSLSQGQQHLEVRMKQLREKESKLRERVARCVHLLAHLPKKESREQKLYHQQILTWVETMQRLNSEVESLKLQVRESQQHQSPLPSSTAQQVESKFQSPSARVLGSPLASKQAAAASPAPLFTPPSNRHAIPKVTPSTPSAFSARAAHAAATTGAPSSALQSRNKTSLFSAANDSGRRSLAMSSATFSSPDPHSRGLARPVDSAVAPSGVVTLSSEELEACEDLLGSLGQVLEQKKELVRKLERDLQEVRQVQTSNSSPRR